MEQQNFKVKKNMWKEVKRFSSVYALIAIPVVFYIVMKYTPLWNAQIAFRDFKSVRYGIVGSPFVGMKNFSEFFHSYYFWFKSEFCGIASFELACGSSRRSCRRSTGCP